MAVQLNLVRKTDEGNLDSTLSLWNYEDGIAVYDWIPQIAADIGPVIEPVGLRLKASTHNAFSSIVQNIDEKKLQAQWYHSGLDLYAVWLQNKLENETYSRRALVLDMIGQMGRPLLDEVFGKNTTLLDYSLAVRRMPYWEDESTQSDTWSNQSLSGGELDLSYDIDGDVSGRVYKIEADPYQATPLNEFWIGFRSDRFWDRTQFVPVWNCSDGIAGVDTAIVTTATCTFATETMEARFYMRVMDACSSTAQCGYQRGEFQVLMMASVSAGTTANVRLSHGFYDAGDATDYGVWIMHNNRTQITTTSGFLYDLGVVRFPSTRGQYSTLHMTGQAIRIEAERTTGSGSLVMTKFILIPRSEGMIYCKGGPVSSSDKVVIITHPDDRVEGLFYDGGITPGGALEVSTANWGIPRGSVRLIVAAQRETLHNTSDRINLTIYTYDRWRTLKGAG